MTRVLVVGATPAAHDRLAVHPGLDIDTVSVAAGIEELTAKLSHSAPPVAVVVGDDLDAEDATALADYLSDVLPAAGQVVLGTDLTPGRPGHREVLSAEATGQEVAAALLRVGAIAPVADPDQAAPGRALVVASPKGGVGKSTVAVNVAVQLATLCPLQVVLVDCDLQFGDVASMLDVTAGRTVVDAVAAGDDSVLLKTYLAKHPSGLVVLTAPDSPTAGEHLTIDQAKGLIETLKSLFPIVIVDTGSGLNDPAVGALEAADEVVFVTSMDVASLRGLRREIEVLDALGVAPLRRLVVNFADQGSGMTVHDIAGVLGIKPEVVVPHDVSVVLSNNQGTPLVLANPQSEPAKLLAGFAERLAGTLGESVASAPRHRSRPRWRREKEA